MVNVSVFYFFAALLLGSALLVITSRNAVKSALALILAFVSCSGLWILIHAEFLALILILVYVGAVMVLFLFVVMMLNLNLSQLKEGFAKQLPIAVLVSLVIAVQLIYVFKANVLGTHAQLLQPGSNYNNTAELGKLLYTEYALTFEIAAVLLLVAMIAAVTLTHRGTKQRRVQKIGQQIKAHKSSRLEVIDSADKRLI